MSNSIWQVVIAPLKSAPSLPLEAEVADFESRIGVNLPLSYRTFLLEFNGGWVSLPYRRDVGAIGLDSLYCFSKGRTEGLVQIRKIQEEYLWCNRWAIEIGDNGCTGYYYLILAGDMRGSVYFVYREDRRVDSIEMWNSVDRIIRGGMEFVCSSFEELPFLVYKSLENPPPVP